MVNSDNQLKNCDLDISRYLSEEYLIAKGSESFLYKGSFINLQCVIKERKSKKYRIKRIDEEIRLSRMRLEARIIKACLRSKINVPAVYGVELKERKLILEYISGKSLSEYTNHHQYFFQLGREVAKLHALHIIHSDLSPLNVIISNDDILYLIDFGLAYFSEELKDKIMDLFIFQGSLKLLNINTEESATLFDSFQNGYAELTDANQHVKMLQELESLAKKGRYQKQ
jgi:Kae1-associated kinase Bud32